MNRRTFLKTAAATGAALFGGSVTPSSWAQKSVQAAGSAPNLLVIIVDQMRFPQWFPEQTQLDAYLPNLARLRTGAVNLSRHYTAAAACTPARAALVTGLYTHQSYCMVTGGSALDTGFPTWGGMLAEQMGYHTYWLGKWHLAGSESTCPDLTTYGFTGGSSCPDPHGAPGQGESRDPAIAQQFETWVKSASARQGPWCTTVSFVNPHDIMWYPRFTEQIEGEANPPEVFREVPPNYETPEELIARQKPRIQRSLQQVAAQSIGPMPFNGPNYETAWTEMLDLYLLLQQYVDTEIGRVLDALEAQPQLAANTVILFTADHGEYCGSHGLRGKAASVYEESIHVPLYVKDLTGRYVAHPESARTQLTSSVDVAPLLLTLAAGSDAWRQNEQLAHLAERPDLAAILRDPDAAGRDYILHTSDEPGNEEDPSTPYTDNPPGHIIGYRTPTAKFGLYSYWQTGTTDLAESGQEHELYDYSTTDGVRELANLAPNGGELYDALQATLLNDALPNELRAPLPDYLLAAQERARTAYLAAYGDNNAVAPQNGDTEAALYSQYLPMILH